MLVILGFTAGNRASKMDKTGKNNQDFILKNSRFESFLLFTTDFYQK